MKNFFLYGSPLSSRGNDFFLFLFRLTIGGMMLVHGGMKLASFGVLSAVFPDPLGVTPVISLILSILAEVGCSVLLICGILTRVVVWPLIINMVIAVWVIHGNDSYQVKEIGILYLAVYVLFFFLGGGRFSLDYFFFGRRR